MSNSGRSDHYQTERMPESIQQREGLGAEHVDGRVRGVHAPEGSQGGLHLLHTV